ncbi:MAG: thiamine pyrophosphate-dependent dehydrogenase E1 component subunit alpha [Hyphomicrobiales bacterium]|nr:thiamine pyrophosphate-dependent dehydrogenase E1 component subunit alpha [Hyphomicrobiales bacterium]
MTPAANLPEEVEHGLARYRTMLTIRYFEETVCAAAVAGRIRGPVHPYIGEEAIATGVCAALRRDDYVASTHRGHGHAIGKGADPAAMMLELYGRVGGLCGGKGGSMHVADFSIGMLGANGVIGDGVTMSLGAIQGSRLLGRDVVAAAFIGDGGMNRGPVLEALNWAKTFRLPVLFVCEDNRYSASTHSRSVTAGPGFTARAAGFGLPAEMVDGNDVIEVERAARTMVEQLRAGAGPMFLHALTYRIGGHLAQDAAPYRPKEELARRSPLDPLTRIETWLAHHGIETHTLEAERAAVRESIATAERAAQAADFPPAASVFADIQDIGAPQWGA